jgi:Na+/H+ antiporter NhaC
MTRTLKIATVGLWIIILIIWTGNLFLGISAEVSDNVTEGIVEPIQEFIQSEILQRQLISILFLIPMLIIFGLIIKAIRTKNNYLFYI